MTGDRLPRNLRRRAAAERVARPRCYCGRPVGPLSACQCCCAEHDEDVNATARALLAIGTGITVTYPATDGGPSITEYLTSKGEL